MSGEKDDISVLRPTIHLGGHGVSGILNAMKVGTGEIKELLIHQCNIIYECKVCQNLFRGLANFIAHKRVYCQQQHIDSRLPFVDTAQEQETVVVHPKAPAEKKEKPKPEWDDYIDTDDETPPPKKEPRMPVFEQMQKGVFRGTSPGYQFYTKAVERQNRKEQDRKKATLSLEKLSGSNSAVRQKLKDDSTITVEPKEPTKGRGRPKKRKKPDDEEETAPKVIRVKNEDFEEEPEEEVIVVEPKAATGHIRMNLRQRGSNGSNTLLEQLKRRSDCDVKSLECLKCKQSYATVKTLHFHMTSQHEMSGKRTFYPCPLCSAVYAQVWSTTRHISTAHNHTRQQARALAEQIRKNAFQKPIGDLGSSSNVNSNSNGANEKKPAVSATSVAATVPKSETSDKDFGHDFVMHRCKGCDKLFERKDSHDRHARTCAMAKQAAAATETKPEPAESKTSNNNNNGSTSSSSSSTTTPVSSTLTQMVSNSEISAEEMQSILEIIDESTHQCLKCYRMFGTISNLHRHAIRHLGWRRFKCQFCRFLSYNKSECRRHLRVVHQKAISKSGGVSAMHVDKFIDKIEASDVDASPKNKLPRVDMKSGVMSAGRGSPRKTRGAAQRAASSSDTVLVTRSGMYNKPTFRQLTKGRNSKNEADDGDDDSDSGDTSDTSVDSSKPEAQEDSDDIMQVKQDVTNSRNRRKGQAPQRSSTAATATEPQSGDPSSGGGGGGSSPRPPPAANTPATARPASHILSHHHQSPAKSSASSSSMIITTTPTKNNPATASPGKSPMVNILSKSVPKFSISGGVTTVLLPVFTQCIQVQSGGGGGSPGSARRIRPAPPPPPPPQPVSQQPHIRVLGPNFQLPGSSGTAHVRTIAVSTLPTSGIYTITGTNAGTNATRPSAGFATSGTTVSGGSLCTMASSAGTTFSLSGASVVSSLPASSTFTVTGNNTTGGMPILCPMQPISVPSVDTSAPVSSTETVTVSLDSSCQLSPAMPSLAPIATHTITEPPTGALAAGTTVTSTTQRRSLTPQPVKAVVPDLDLKPRSFTPNPAIPALSQLVGGEEVGQITIESLPPGTETALDIHHPHPFPKIDSSSNISFVTDLSGAEEVLSSNGNVTGEELITIAGSTESSRASSQLASTVEDDNNYIVSVTPASQCQFLLDDQGGNEVTEDAYVTVTTTAAAAGDVQQGAESTEVVAMDTAEGVELLQMIDSSATDPMQYINQDSTQP